MARAWIPPHLERPFPEVDGVKVRHDYHNVLGLMMHVAEAGPEDGDPLILLHGWPQHWWMWRNQIAAFKDEYRVICPDLRGLGWSQATRRGYKKEEMANDIVRLIDVLGLPKPVNLMGHDWGGWIGFLISILHPGVVNRYIALNIPPPYNAGPRMKKLRCMHRFVYQPVLATPGLGTFICRRVPHFMHTMLTKDAHRTRSEQEIQNYLGPLRVRARARASSRLYRDFLLREAPFVAFGRYRDHPLEIPARLFWGMNDYVLRKPFMEGWKPYAPLMLRIDITDSGHFVAEDQPLQVTTQARAFFKASPSAFGAAIGEEVAPEKPVGPETG
jgi:pimeloyl-ACP methyl ester carboxylesterase